MIRSLIGMDPDRIVGFCRKWRIQEFSLLGSILRDDFRPDSDADVLVEFELDHPRSLFDVTDMEDELRELFGRDVDLVMKGGLRNPFRLREILSTRQIVYAA